MNRCTLDGLGAFSDILQLINFILNVSQSTTDEIMTELQHQNKEYLGKAIEQNEIIIKQNYEILEKLDHEQRRNNKSYREDSGKR